MLTTTEHRADVGLRPGGFGMLIVRQVVDELVYNEKGNEVIMIKHTGRTIEEIERDTDRDKFMSSDEAREYGLIDNTLEHLSHPGVTS